MTASTSNWKTRLSAFLMNPWVSLGTMFLGGFLGYNGRDGEGTIGMLPVVMEPVGNIFLTLLGMCVLPIIGCAIIAGVGSLLKSGAAGAIANRLILVFMGGVLIAGTLGMLAGVLGQPGGHLSAETRVSLGRSFMEAGSEPDMGSTSIPGLLLDLIKQIVPDNIFTALNVGNSLAIVFVAILVGMALGVSDTKGSEYALETLDAISKAFMVIIGWLLYFLPLGLFAIAASQMAVIDIEVLVVLLRFVLLYYLVGLVMCCLYLAAIRIGTGCPVGQILSRTKKTLIVTFATRSSYAGIPLAIRSLQEDFGQDHTQCQLLVPLTVLINRHSYAAYFALTTIFIAQIYMQPASLQMIVVSAVVGALVGMAAIGSPVVVAPMMGFILRPLGLPLDMAIMIIIFTGPLVEPMMSLMNVFNSFAVTSLVARKPGADIGDNEAPAMAAVE